mmetsp:Transcript_14844/g.31881  ORF Transcript_14844/g.31881 Transcript_14844/m.31881 type:complete len:372 (-) Transcript_14844:478-1593(-)|eukprot:CAMPEP_0118924160 /NCGR_PEP_ID=MMETSP1169-20130426/2421_1 /TAXON_ID=36882 /ORGANISM="Pyramimonas obovata, Strain CCMP722" /LENGTH=371 /DNA_ID=CAMNT_0006865247 /DNA_START=168 /DNA_END=1283 /DNA_ORIENTATION=-
MLRTSASTSSGVTSGKAQLTGGVGGNKGAFQTYKRHSYEKVTAASGGYSLQNIDARGGRCARSHGRATRERGSVSAASLVGANVSRLRNTNCRRAAASRCCRTQRKRDKWRAYSNGEANEPNKGEEEFSQEDLDTLSTRIARLQEDEMVLPLILLDALLPRQRLQLTITKDDPSHLTMVQAALKSSRTFAMLGVDPRTQTPLRHGTEVEITQFEELPDGALEIEVVGRRRLSLLGEPVAIEAGYTIGMVELCRGVPEKLDEEAQMRVLELSLSLEPEVEEWQRLVREGGHERQPDQLTSLYRDLGPLPPAEDCDDRALWVAALINPVPALGVAYEIRPAVLTAQSTTTRLEVALAAIKSSINHLNGTAPLF